MTQHVFESAGLGLAPFQFVKFERREHYDECDYCGTGILNLYWLRSADGRHFKVGCDCVELTHDAGLIKRIRTVKQEMRWEERARKKEETMRRIEEFVRRFNPHGTEETQLTEEQRRQREYAIITRKKRLQDLSIDKIIKRPKSN